MSLFPIGDQGDFSAFNSIGSEFKQWTSSIAAQRLAKLDKDTPTLKLWHLNGSEKTLGVNQYLYTFMNWIHHKRRGKYIVKNAKTRFLFFRRGGGCF